MAEIDSSVYSRIKGLDLSGLAQGFKDGMTLGQMAKDSKLKEDQILRENKMQDDALAKDKQKNSLKFIVDAASNIKDQASLDQYLGQAQKFGYDTSDIGSVYNPETQKKLNFYGNMAISELDKQKLAEQSRHNSIQEKQTAFDNNIKREELSLKKEKTPASEGFKTLDKEYAKDHNEWTSGGAQLAQTEIGKLQNVVNNLKSGAVTTGGLTGLFSDRITSNDLLQARSDVQSTVMNSLRAIMGASFTEKEGERVIKNTWNESDSTENNLARLERLVGDLSNQANAKNAKSEIFQKTGSLRSMESPAPQQIIRMKNKAGEEFDIPADKKGEAIASGLSVK